MPALVGGGPHARPGEISLAHNGVLFLDELPEFQPQALDALRQPLETGEVAISRANHRAVYPARFQLVAAMNPCRCGHALEPGYSCRRGAPQRCAQTYQTRLSGPFLDRIDLHLEVPAIRASDLILPAPTEGSAEVAARVAAAREIQRDRFQKLGRPDINNNAAAPAALVEEIVILDEAARNLIRSASEKYRLSARGFHRVLKLARTIADLQGAPDVKRSHLAEALSYRSTADRNVFVG
jgi:magnesium chelatase family protein